MNSALLMVYGAPLALIWGWYLRRQHRAERHSVAARERSESAGFAQPASLHPVVDTVRCIGCGSCVKACPEQPEHHVLGLIGNKAQLVSPSECIGHGACRSACPVDAITLVFGSAERGIDIPLLSPSFESTVPGIYIAGELGGMGLIRNALSQGMQAVNAIHRHRGRAREAGVLDLLIVGAGPAGFAASLTAMSHGLKFATVEQDSLGGCVFQYPRAKMVMTSPVTLPLVGKLRFGHTSKEALLEFWQGVEQKMGLPIRYGERVESIAREADGFIVRTTRASIGHRPCCWRSGDAERRESSKSPGRNCRRWCTGSSIRSSTPGRTCSWSEAATARSRRRRAWPRAVAVRSRCPIAALRSHARSRAIANALRPRERSGRLQVLLESQVRRIDAESVVLSCRGLEMALAVPTRGYRQRRRHSARRIPAQGRRGGRNEIWHRVVDCPAASATARPCSAAWCHSPSRPPRRPRRRPAPTGDPMQPASWRSVCATMAARCAY